MSLLFMQELARSKDPTTWPCTDYHHSRTRKLLLPTGHKYCRYTPHSRGCGHVSEVRAENAVQGDGLLKQFLRGAADTQLWL